MGGSNELVGVFVGSSLPWAVGVSEEHLHASAWGEALVAGDLTAHHRGTTPNRASDTHLG